VEQQWRLGSDQQGCWGIGGMICARWHSRSGGQRWLYRRCLRWLAVAAPRWRRVCGQELSTQVGSSRARIVTLGFPTPQIDMDIVI
jgi:hypothetical protein